MLKNDHDIEAKKFMEEVVRFEKHDPGPQHPETILSIDLLGQCELTIENFTAAEDCLSAASEQLENMSYSLRVTWPYYVGSNGGMTMPMPLQDQTSLGLRTLLD